MWLLLLCLRLSNKTINEVIPPLGGDYVLYQSPQKSYSNIDECLLSEIALPKQITQSIIDKYRGDLKWEEIKNKDLSKYLIDEKNPLTEDEKFAISLYSIEPYFYNSLSQVLNVGVTGQFNCYFQYLRSGFDKLKPYLQKKSDLYRGVTTMSTVVNYNNYKKDDIVHTTSFTSSSLSRAVGLDFSNSGMVFIIHGQKNPRCIIPLSFISDEDELLYPPSTKFKVTKDPYFIYCIYDRVSKNSECADTKKYSYYNEYVFVELEELDEEYGPIKTISDGGGEDDDEKNCKHLDVSWWGWLLIGIVVGLVCLAICWFIVDCICR